MSAFGKIIQRPLSFISGEYGMAAVLVLLCILFSVLTIEEKSPEGAQGGKSLAKDIIQLVEKDSLNFPKELQIFIAAGEGKTGELFASSIEKELITAGLNIKGIAVGNPPKVRKAIQSAGKIDLIATTASLKSLPVFDSFLGEKKYPLPTNSKDINDTLIKGENLKMKRIYLLSIFLVTSDLSLKYKRIPIINVIHPISSKLRKCSINPVA